MVEASYIRRKFDDFLFGWKSYTDTGLLVAQLDAEAQADLRINSNLGVYNGGLYENIVANGGFAIVG